MIYHSITVVFFAVEGPVPINSRPSRLYPWVPASGVSTSKDMPLVAETCMYFFDASLLDRDLASVVSNLYSYSVGVLCTTGSTTYHTCDFVAYADPVVYKSTGIALHVRK